MSLSSTGRTYELYNEQLVLEKYINILPQKLWKPILKLET